LIQVAQSQELFTQTGPITIFVPTDDAFDKFSQGRLDEFLQGDNNQELVRSISYHVLSGSYSSQDLVENSTVTTVDDLELKLSGNSQGQIIINDYAVVTKENIRVDNAIIHLVDSVLLPTEEQSSAQSEVISVYTGLYNGTATISNSNLVFQTASFNLNPNGSVIISGRNLSLQFLNDPSVLIDNQYPAMTLVAEGNSTLNTDGSLVFSFTNVGVVFEAGNSPITNEQSNRIVASLQRAGIIIPSGTGLVTTVLPILTPEGLRLQSLPNQPLLLNMELQKV
jgi:hypothetical protein